MKIAIATVTSHDFLTGSLVLIHSFLQNNKWFNGDIILIHNEPDPSELDIFDFFPNVVFQEPHALLREKIHILQNKDSEYNKKAIRFLSIEVFRLNQYDTILFLDSDMLCLQNVRSLFSHNLHFMASPDYKNILGFNRDKTTFRPVKRSDKHPSLSGAFKSFNTGLMVIGKTFLNYETYTSICQYVCFDLYQHIQSNHTDSFAINLKFEGEISWLDPSYNTFSRLLYKMEPSLSTKTLKSIKFIHFLGRAKPWLFIDRDVEFPFHSKIFQLWVEKYKELKHQLKVE